MNEQEKAALKVLAHCFIDQVEQSLIDAELAKISNPQVLAVAKLLEAALLPAAIKAEDVAVDKALA